MRWVHARSQLCWCGALALWFALTEHTVSRAEYPPLLTFRVSWGLWCLSAPAFGLRQVLHQFCTEQKSSSWISCHWATSGAKEKSKGDLKVMVGFPDKKKVLSVCQSISKFKQFAPDLQWQPRDGSRIPYLLSSKIARRQNWGFSSLTVLNDFADVSPDLRLVHWRPTSAL